MVAGPIESRSISLGVQCPDGPVGGDGKFHDSLPPVGVAGRRRMLRRGRSTVMPAERLADVGQLGGHPFAEVRGLPEPGGGGAPDCGLRLVDEGVKLGVGSHGQRPEAFEEIGEVGDGRVAEDPGVAVLLAAESFAKVADGVGKLLGECLLGQSDGLVKLARDPARSCS